MAKQITPQVLLNDLLGTTEVFNRTSKKQPLESMEIYRQKQALYISYSNQIYEYAYSMFKWENLPKEIPPLYVEKTLHRNGEGLFWHNKGTFYFTPFRNVTISRDMYGQYRKVTPIPEYNNGLITLSSVRVLPTAEYIGNELHEFQPEAAICLNSPNRINTGVRISPFLYDLVDITMTMRNRLNWHKNPYVYRVPSGGALNARKEFEKIEGHERIIIEEDSYPSMNLSAGLQEINNNTEFINDKLRVELNATWDKVMLFLGINNTNQDKTERMISDEVNSNNEQVLYSRNLLLSQRREFCTTINELFGLDVHVRLRNSSEMLEQLGEQLEGQEMLEGDFNV